MFIQRVFCCFAYFFIVCLVDLFACFTVLTKFESQKVKQKVENETILSNESTQSGQLFSAGESSRSLEEKIIQQERVVVSVPTPNPVPISNITAVSPQDKQFTSSGELEVFFGKYSFQYGVDERLLKKIARCESHFNPQAVNGPFAGMYQFTARTWASSRQAMGLDPNLGLRFNLEEAIKTAAFKISRDGAAAWPVCSR